ncbi:hypothetical protein ACH5BF_02160 [Arcobacter sp. YIC-464]|uniref:hypothetical protein n=1 Tax=Arcobacter sp. YIC-464 TaxID=3376631 RepID=UPI003C2029FE
MQKIKVEFEKLINESIDKSNNLTKENNTLTLENIIFDKDFFILNKTGVSLDLYYDNNKININCNELILNNCEINKFIINNIVRNISKLTIKDNCKINELEFINNLALNIDIQNSKIQKIKFEDINKNISPSILKTHQNDYNTKINFDNNTIKNIEILNSDFYGRFYFSKFNHLDKQEDKKNDIKNIKIINSNFYNNFKLHNSTIEKFEIYNTNFEKDADFYKTKFLAEDKKEIYFKSCIFKGLVLFGSSIYNEKVIFEYVTFKEHGHFKNAVFKNGIDLELAIIEKEINFYGIEIKKESNVSQETYRIIKHQLEKLGNKIQANKYYSLELLKRKHNLPFYSPNKWALQLHQWSSNFYQWWFLAFFWIFCTSLFTAMYIHNQSFYDIFYNVITFNESYIKTGLSKIINYMSIINMNKEFIESNFIAFALNKLFLGYLYFQFITSFRKDARK